MDTHTMNTQIEQPATESHTKVVREVSWDNINYENLDFSGDYKVCLGTAGQLILAINELATQLDTKLADAANEFNGYQKSLYPRLRDLAQQITDRYYETFISDVCDNVQLQVFGANLNGIYNNGTLRHIIATSRIPRGLCYKYAQFGQLLKVLTQRLEYIATRETDGVERYRTDPVQREHFVTLQKACKEFVEYLNGVPNGEGGVDISNSVTEQWNIAVEQAREIGGITIETQRANRKEKRAKLAEKREQYRQAQESARESTQESTQSTQENAQENDSNQHGGEKHRHFGNKRRFGVRTNKRYATGRFEETLENKSTSTSTSRPYHQPDYVKHCDRMKTDYGREQEHSGEYPQYQQQYRQQYRPQYHQHYRPQYHQQYRPQYGDNTQKYVQYNQYDQYDQYGQQRYHYRPRFQHGDSFELLPNYPTHESDQNESNRPQSFGRFPVKRQRY